MIIISTSHLLTYEVGTFVACLFFFVVIEWLIKWISKSSCIKSFFATKYNDYLKALDFLLSSFVHASICSIYIIAYLYSHDKGNETSLDFLTHVFIFSIAYCLYDL